MDGFQMLYPEECFTTSDLAHISVLIVPSSYRAVHSLYTRLTNVTSKGL